MKFCWTTINVRDMENSLSFYQDVIGLKLNRRVTPAEGRELAFLGEGATQLELIANAKNTQIEFGKDISLGFVVQSLDQFTEFLTTKGIPVQAGPFQPNPFIRFMYIQDPDGLKIQLVENIA